MTAGTILIVDDDPESLKLLATILMADDYQVRPADSGELALAWIDRSIPVNSQVSREYGPLGAK